MSNPEILKFNPYFSHNIWGGTRLKEEFGYNAEGDDIGECWGISACPGKESTVSGGSLDGMKLSQVYKKYPALFGKTPEQVQDSVFPLLVKIIDAREDLSIQVHPDDRYAKAHEGSLGKMECWYVLDCPGDATLVLGHNAKTREELCDMIDQGRWDELIRQVPVHPGDFIQIDPGTVHAIKAGTLLIETQQNSDITYRLYDYDRLQNGKKRQLHLKQSKEVITVPAEDNAVVHAPDIEPGRYCELHRCERYIIGRIRVQGPCTLRKQDPYLCATVIFGNGSINGTALKKGDHMIITSETNVLKMDGSMELVVSSENSGVKNR